MADWIKNLIPYEKYHKKEPCPFCKSENVSIEYVITDVKKTDLRKSVLFKCLDCGKSTCFCGTYKN